MLAMSHTPSAFWSRTRTQPKRPVSSSMIKCPPFPLSLQPYASGDSGPNFLSMSLSSKRLLICGQCNHQGRAYRLGIAIDGDVAMHTCKLLAELLEGIAQMVLPLRLGLFGDASRLFEFAFLRGDSCATGIRWRGILQRLFGVLNVRVLRRRRERGLQVLGYTEKMQRKLCICGAARQDRARG